MTVRRSTKWAVVLLLIGIPSSAARADEQVVATLPGAMGLSAYGGHVIWSQPDAATGRWRLMQWHAGRITRVAVGERSVPFDADAGPDVRGRAIAVFSRCGNDPRE